MLSVGNTKVLRIIQSVDSSYLSEEDRVFQAVFCPRDPICTGVLGSVLISISARRRGVSITVGLVVSRVLNDSRIEHLETVLCLEGLNGRLCGLYFCFLGSVKRKGEGVGGELQMI